VVTSQGGHCSQAPFATQVSQLTRNNTDAAENTVLQDGKWHMLTLSTLYDGTPGYAMFLDGNITAVLDGNYTYRGNFQLMCFAQSFVAKSCARHPNFLPVLYNNHRHVWLWECSSFGPRRAWWITSACF
jgi:hypothetical protein